jgi:serine/threonine protein kinase
MSKDTHEDNQPVNNGHLFKPRELIRARLKLGEELGKGCFGTVLTGSYDDIEKDVAYSVAVKKVNDDAPDEATLEILEEAALMSQLRHPNIERITGVVTASKPHLVIMELATGGALLSYVSPFLLFYYLIFALKLCHMDNRR